MATATLLHRDSGLLPDLPERGPVAWPLPMTIPPVAAPSWVASEFVMGDYDEDDEDDDFFDDDTDNDGAGDGEEDDDFLDDEEEDDLDDDEASDDDDDDL